MCRVIASPHYRRGGQEKREEGGGGGEGIEEEGQRTRESEGGIEKEGCRFDGQRGRKGFVLTGPARSHERSFRWLHRRRGSWSWWSAALGASRTDLLRMRIRCRSLLAIATR